MDPATVIALCKENIQPLRHGRNAAQLGTALRAQEDTEAHQLLMQEKQWGFMSLSFLMEIYIFFFIIFSLGAMVWFFVIGHSCFC